MTVLFRFLQGPGGLRSFVVMAIALFLQYYCGFHILVSKTIVIFEGGGFPRI